MSNKQNLQLFILSIEDSTDMPNCGCIRSLVVAAANQEEAKSITTEYILKFDQKGPNPYTEKVKRFCAKAVCQMIGYAAENVGKGVLLEDYLEYCDG